MRILAPFRNLPAPFRRSGALPERVPAFLADHGFQGLEIADRELTAGVLEGLVQSAGAYRSKGLDLVVDINADLTLRGDRARQGDIVHCVRQLEIARKLQAHCCRITLGGQVMSLQRLFRPKRRGRGEGPNALPGKPTTRFAGILAHHLRKQLPVFGWRSAAKIDRAVAALGTIMPIAEHFGLPIGIENHWGISSRPEWILEVIGRVGSPLLGACPDFGNWPRTVSADKGVAKLAPHAIMAHIKAVDAGRTPPDQLGSIIGKIDILRRHRFPGPFTIEYEGTGEGWPDIATTQKLLRGYRRP